MRSSAPFPMNKIGNRNCFFFFYSFFLFIFLKLASNNLISTSFYIASVSTSFCIGISFNKITQNNFRFLYKSFCFGFVLL